MESNKSFFINNLPKSLLFFGININIFIPLESPAKTQENLVISKVFSYRLLSCSCCKKWVNHLRDYGLEVVDNIVEDISEVKKQYNVPNNLRSCHSAKTGNNIIEGHVPIKSINKLFKEKSRISGITFPGLPHGSTGMETHSHASHSHNYETYEVVSFSKNGKTKIFELISP